LAMILQDSQIRNQLASYTVDGQGNIKSTNTWRQMPTLSSSNDILPEDINSRLSTAIPDTPRMFFSQAHKMHYDSPSA
jgi:hypothetical protein